MDAAYVSALAALAGSAIGALSSFATTWLGQNAQHTRSRAEKEQARREAIYGEFIDNSSALYAEALSHELEDAAGLVRLYSLVNRMKLFASRDIVEHGERVIDMVVMTYRAPNRSLRDLQQGGDERPDPLHDFSAQCRRELDAGWRR